MKYTLRASIALALLAAACGGGAPDATQDDLGVAHCRPFARCGLTGPQQYCADLSSDEANCGACGQRCSAGEVCLGGSCAMPCTDGLVSCRDADPAYCTDVTSSEANCGACGLPCAGDQFCDSGQCVPACTPGLTNCGTPDARACADLQTDGQNCGACGRACPPGYACTAGGCTLICLAPTSYCPDVGQGEYCADLQTSAQNCGACGNACAAGRACSGGVCVAICDAPLAQCGTECANLQTDALNCGGCGVACGTGYTCEAGSCVLQCAVGELHCGADAGQYCISPNDPGNCGACGNVCGNDKTCTDGVCVCSVGQICGTTCVDKTTDPFNCGNCGVTCSGFEPVCVEGVCSADPTATSYAAAVLFTDVLLRPYTSLTFQGGASPAYWSNSSGTSGYNVASYDPATFVSKKYTTTSQDFRAIFSEGGSGDRVYGRLTRSPYVLQMMLPGVFTAMVPLNGSTVDVDGSVAMARIADVPEFVTFSLGTVRLWDVAGGTIKGEIPLQGFGSVTGENGSPQNIRMAVAGDKLLTYYAGTLHIWDRAGVRLRSVRLEGAGVTSASHFSLSYANGYVWVLDNNFGGKWRGYRVGGL